MKKTTEKQDRFLKFVDDFWQENGYAPSVREIAKGLGLASTSGVHNMIDRLNERGLLQREAGTARTLCLSSTGHFGHVQDLGIPIMGRIKAGIPVQSEENIEGYISSEFLNGLEDCFFLIVDGDSMKNRGLLNGDYALIKPQKYVEDEQIGAFYINGETTLKIFKRAEDKILLIPANDDYMPIVVHPEDDFQVIGKFIMMVRFEDKSYHKSFMV